MELYPIYWDRSKGTIYDASWPRRIGTGLEYSWDWIEIRLALKVIWKTNLGMCEVNVLSEVVFQRPKLQYSIQFRSKLSFSNFYHEFGPLPEYRYILSILTNWPGYFPGFLSTVFIQLYNPMVYLSFYFLFWALVRI